MQPQIYNPNEILISIANTESEEAQKVLDICSRLGINSVGILGKLTMLDDIDSYIKTISDNNGVDQDHIKKFGEFLNRSMSLNICSGHIVIVEDGEYSADMLIEIGHSIMKLAIGGLNFLVIYFKDGNEKNNIPSVYLANDSVIYDNVVYVKTLEELTLVLSDVKESLDAERQY